MGWFVSCDEHKLWLEVGMFYVPSTTNSRTPDPAVLFIITGYMRLALSLVYHNSTQQ